MAAGVRRAAACPACCTAAGAALRSNAVQCRCPAWRLPTDGGSLHNCSSTCEEAVACHRESRSGMTVVGSQRTIATAATTDATEHAWWQG